MRRRRKALLRCPVIIEELLELFSSRGVPALVLLLLLAPFALAADPGHDSLYIEESGDSALTGSLNISDQLKVANLLYSANLHVQGNATIPVTAATKPNVYAVDSSYLYLNAPTGIYLAKDAGSTVYVGGSGVNLNVSGTIYQQNVMVCLANGTNCLTGNNSGNISTISAGNGISVDSPNGPTATISTSAATCGASEYSYWDGNSWECRADNNDGSGGYSSSAAGWTNTSTKTSTDLNVNVTTGNLTVPNGRIGVGTNTPAAYLHAVTGTSNSINMLYTAYQNNILSHGPASLTVSSDNSGGAVLQVTGTGTADLFRLLDGTTTAFYVLDGGKVGILTPSPTSQFHVNKTFIGSLMDGHEESNASATFGDDEGKQLRIFVNTNTTNSYVALSAVNTGIGNMNLTLEAFRVGINTAAPTQTLDVSGSGNFSGTNAQLWVNGSLVCTAANGFCGAAAETDPLWQGNSSLVYYASNPQGYYNSSTAKVTVESLWHGNSSLVYYATNSFGFYNSSSPPTLAAVTGAGATTAVASSFTATANPGLTVGDATTGYLKVGGSTVYDNNGALTLDADTAYTAIAEDLLITGNDLLDSGSNARITLGAVTNVTSGTNFTADVNTFHVDATNDRVGIGTTSPTSWLHVNAITTGANALYVKYQNNILTYGGGSLGVSSDNSASPVFTTTGTGTADIIRAVDNTTTVFVVKDEGNVGIGTASPSKRLDVSNGTQAITFDPTVISPTINTTGGNLTIDSLGGYVIINIG